MPNSVKTLKGPGAHRRTQRRTDLCSGSALVGKVHQPFIFMKFASSPPARRARHSGLLVRVRQSRTPIGGATAHQAGTTQQAMRCPTWGLEWEAGMTKRSMSSFQLKLLKIIEESRFGREM